MRHPKLDRLSNTAVTLAVALRDRVTRLLEEATMTTDQLALGDTTPLVRNTDPQAARNAVERAGRGLGKSKARMLCTFLIRDDLAPTEAAELAMKRGLGVEAKTLDSHRRRVQDLAKDGFLYATGEERHGIVYRLTPKGWQAAQASWPTVMPDTARPGQGPSQP